MNNRLLSKFRAVGPVPAALFKPRYLKALLDGVLTAVADVSVASSFGPWDLKAAALYYWENYGQQIDPLDLELLCTVIVDLASYEGSGNTLIVSAGIYETLLAVNHTVPDGRIDVFELTKGQRDFLELILSGSEEPVSYYDEEQQLITLIPAAELDKWEAILVELGNDLSQDGGERYRGMAEKARVAFRNGRLRIRDGSVFALPP